MARPRSLEGWTDADRQTLAALKAELANADLPDGRHGAIADELAQLAANVTPDTHCRGTLSPEQEELREPIRALLMHPGLLLVDPQVDALMEEYAFCLKLEWSWLFANPGLAFWLLERDPDVLEYLGRRFPAAYQEQIDRLPASSRAARLSGMQRFVERKLGLTQPIDLGALDDEGRTAFRAYCKLWEDTLDELARELRVKKLFEALTFTGVITRAEATGRDGPGFVRLVRELEAMTGMAPILADFAL